MGESRSSVLAGESKNSIPFNLNGVFASWTLPLRLDASVQFETLETLMHVQTQNLILMEVPEHLGAHPRNGHDSMKVEG